MKKIFLFILLSFLLKNGFSQIDSISAFCKKYIQYPYISDGQEYFALLSSGQTGEFHITFYGGTTYRIVACSEPTDKSLKFRIYDKKRNEIFSNEKHDMTTYWDIKFTSTINCIIETELPENKVSGIAMLMIGFKQ